jgi:LmbE family N-acetylglucosaminyl deacetylase
LNARYTLVALHAHPDDEALYTGGTLARCRAEGHRVVVVTATAGERGLAVDPADLGRRRLAELKESTRLLGVSRLVTLGYGDSGFGGPGGGGSPPLGSLCAADAAEVAARFAAVLAEERADAVIVYDANGGYGHRDHVRVHEAGVAAAAAAGAPLVLEATLPREPLLRALRLLNAVGVRPGGMTPAHLQEAYQPRARLTHSVDVRPWVALKRRALAAHASQATGGGGDVRTVRLLTRLPMPLARVVLGREFYVQRGLATPSRLHEDLFFSLRGR